MEIRKIKYPYEPDSEQNNIWYKFGSSEGAVQISNDRIEEWVNECVKSVKNQLENGIESPYAFSASGDTIVICFYNQEDDEIFSDDNCFTVIVAKNYEQGDFFINDIKITGSNKRNVNCEIGDITLNDIIEAVENKETIKLKGYEIDIRKVD